MSGKIKNKLQPCPVTLNSYQLNSAKKKKKKVIKVVCATKKKKKNGRCISVRDNTFSFNLKY